MVLRKYKCCGQEFERDVVYKTGNVNPKTGEPSRKKAWSTPVMCPKCRNFIKTWQ